MVDPQAGARCAIRDTRAPDAERYHWTVAIIGEPALVATGRTGELGEARSLAEGALRAYAENGGLASYRRGVIG
jgi:hypothetical protein